MHRIDTAGSVAGMFTEGDAGAGTPATVVGAAWMNDLQENIMAVLDDAGVAPVKGSADDLLQAIVAIATGAAGSGGGSVPTGRIIATSGLATGGGDMTANRTIAVAAATSAEVVAGTVTTKAVTPAALFAAFAGGLGAGSFKIGPIEIKWGSYAGFIGESTIYCPFAVPFVSGCFVAIPVVRNDTASQTRDTWVQNVGAASADGFTIRLQSSGTTSTNTADGFDWVAIGH